MARGNFCTSVQTSTLESFEGRSPQKGLRRTSDGLKKPQKLIKVPRDASGCLKDLQAVYVCLKVPQEAQD